MLDWLPSDYGIERLHLNGRFAARAVFCALGRGTGPLPSGAWNNVTGGQNFAERPDIAIFKRFPVVLTDTLELTHPKVRDMVDYAARAATQPSAGLDFGYDDFNPFQ